jgi:hypothetical protein
LNRYLVKISFEENFILVCFFLSQETGVAVTLGQTFRRFAVCNVRGSLLGGFRLDTTAGGFRLDTNMGGFIDDVIGFG